MLRKLTHSGADELVGIPDGPEVFFSRPGGASLRRGRFRFPPRARYRHFFGILPVWYQPEPADEHLHVFLQPAVGYELRLNDRSSGFGRPELRFWASSILTGAAL